MEQARLTELIQTTFAKIWELRKKKGAEYAGTHVDDCLANFRRNALDCSLSMEQIWRVYAGKHWDAVNQYIRDTSQGIQRDVMEPIDGRIDDLLVYLLLFKAMVQERREEREAKLPKTAGELVTAVDPTNSPLRKYISSHLDDLENKGTIQHG